MLLHQVYCAPQAAALQPELGRRKEGQEGQAWMSLCGAIYHITLSIARGTLLPPTHLLGLPSLSACLRAASTPLFMLLLLHGKSVSHLWMMPIPVSLSLYVASDWGQPRNSPSLHTHYSHCSCSPCLCQTAGPGRPAHLLCPWRGPRAADLGAALEQL